MEELLFKIELYDFHRAEFQTATGKNPDENQQLYLSYLSCIYSLQVLKELRELKEKFEKSNKSL